MAHLSLEEIETLDALFLRAVCAVQELRAEAPVGRFLHAVKLPPRLTESIVALASDPLFGDCCTVLEDRGAHDLRIRTGRGRRVNVAVKGTGSGDWVSITATDREADVVVWVDYSQRLLDHSRPVILRKIPVRRLGEVGDRAFLRRLDQRSKKASCG